MNFTDYIKKWNLSNIDKISPVDVAGFIGTMDYLYCILTREQFIEAMTDFYDNADNIYNEIKNIEKELIKSGELELEDLDLDDLMDEFSNNKYDA